MGAPRGTIGWNVESYNVMSSNIVWADPRVVATGGYQ